MLVEGGSVTALRCIRSICVFPHSSTQESLRGRPLRSTPLSARVGDTYTGGPTFCPHSEQGEVGGQQERYVEQPSSLKMTAFPHSPKHRPTERTRRIWGPSVKVSLRFTDRTPSAAGSAGRGAKNAETTVFAPRCYGSIIIGQRCRNVVKYLEIILLLLFHHPTPTPAEGQSLIGITKHIKVFNIIPTSLWVCVYMHMHYLINRILVVSEELIVKNIG